MVISGYFPATQAIYILLCLPAPPLSSACGLSSSCCVVRHMPGLDSQSPSISEELLANIHGIVWSLG